MASSTRTGGHAVGRMLSSADFRRLLLCRLASQWADGIFQAGLAGAVLFNPERQADPLAIAAGFAVILIPYSVIGPFAGALLDRWDRRRLIVIANIVRVFLVVLAAAADGFGLSNVPLYAAALLVMGVSRFIGSGLSAALPHVVEPRDLVGGNSIVATLGAATAAIGGACAFGLRSLIGAGNVGSALVTSVAIVGALLSCLLAARFAPGQLGPDEINEPSATVVAVARGLVDGGRAALQAPSVAAGFIALAAHRIAYGASLLVIVLLMKYTFHSHGAMKAGAGGLVEAVTAGAAGLLFAGLITPRLVRRFGRAAVVSGGLIVGFAGLLGFGLPMLLPTILIAAFVITASGQVVKLSVDAAIQRDVHDDSRGRVFAVSDTLFNAMQVVGAAGAAWLVPIDGQSPAVVIGTAMLYLVGLAGYLLVLRAHPNSPR